MEARKTTKTIVCTLQIYIRSVQADQNSNKVSAPWAN